MITGITKITNILYTQGRSTPSQTDGYVRLGLGYTSLIPMKTDKHPGKVPIIQENEKTF